MSLGFHSRLAVVLGAICSILCPNGSEAGEISGGVLGTLDLANSPYTVTGDLIVSSGQSLTIEAGVILNFDANITFFIDGTLTAEGTAASHIFFTSNAGSPGAGDWNGIHFRSGSSGTLKYTTIRFAASGVTSTSSAPVVRLSTIKDNNNGIDCFSGSTASIQSNQISNNANAGIRCNASSPDIKGNRIFDNAAFESAIQCDASSPTISENIFYGNGNSAVDCLNGSQPNIWQNTIIQNDFGITLTESDAVVRSNIIAFNQFGILSDNASPVIEFNNVWSNTSGDFQGTPVGVGNLTTTNSNGDPSDAFSNILMDPKFVNLASKDLELQSSSPSIDAADPSNPANVIVTGSRPDQGAFEFGAAVPVELVSFSFAEGSLHWTTATETNNFGFKIQRSSSKAGSFVEVGFVRGAGTTTIPQKYKFRDEVENGIFYYRLKQIDTDGAFEFSPVLKVTYATPSNFALLQNYPNPFNPSTTITFEIQSSLPPEADITLLVVFNSLGQEVVELLKEKRSAGRHEIVWNGLDKSGRQVPSGVYYYQLKHGDYKFTRKMILQK